MEGLSVCRRLTLQFLGANLKIKVLGMALLVVALLGAVAVWQTRESVEWALAHQLNDRATSLAKNLAYQATDASLRRDSFALVELARETRAANRDIRYVFMVGPRGNVLAHTFEDGVPRSLLRVNPSPAGKIRLMQILTDEGLIRDVAAPMLGGKAGIVRVGVTQRHLDVALQESIRRLLMYTVVASLLVLLLACLVTLLMTRPIRDLDAAADALGKGNFDVRAKVWWQDEIGHLAITFNEMASNLQLMYRTISEKEKARTELLQKIIKAQEAERKRVSRELHDEVSQSLGLVSIALKRATESGADHAAEELQSVILQALQRVRSMAFQLRSEVLDDLGLVAAVDEYVEDFRERCGIHAELQSVGMNNLTISSEVAITVYRIVQEALSNVSRHAEARNVSVTLKGGETGVRVLIEDDGCGFDTRKRTSSQNPRSLGIFGMEERASLVGGRVEVESSPGCGTAVSLWIPLNHR